MRCAALCLLLGVAALCVRAAIPDMELVALKALYTATKGDSWKNKDGWLKDGTDPCKDWFGITCTSDGNHIQALSLSNNGLEGSIPEEIGFLADNPISIDFGLNKLSGFLPSNFSLLSKIYAISLKENNLEGSLDFSKMSLFLLKPKCVCSQLIFVSLNSRSSVCSLGLQLLHWNPEFLLLLQHS